MNESNNKAENNNIETKSNNEIEVNNDNELSKKNEIKENILDNKIYDNSNILHEKVKQLNNELIKAKEEKQKAVKLMKEYYFFIKCNGLW